MFAHGYINICAQQLGGVNICCVPWCVFIFLSLSRPLSGLSAKGALCCASGPGWGAAAPGTFIVATPEMWGQSHNLTLFRKYSATASNGEFSRKKTHSCWPEHMELVGCYVRAGQKWKITGAMKLERTDCQTEGKQVFEAIIVTLGCVLTIMWHHIFLSLPSPHFSTWHALAAQHYCWQHSTLASTMIPQILWIGSWFWNNGLNVVSLGWIQGIQECQEGCGGPEESQE